MSDDEIVHDWESDCYVLHIANTNLREERDRLRTENEKLRAALEPFAELALHTGSMSNSDGVCVYVGDLRAARAALKETGDETPST